MKPHQLLVPVLLATILPWFACAADSPALTIYNQNFAVVRDTLPLDLKAGVNEVKFTETTAHLETDSVILRDPTGKVALQVLEQNYRNDPISQEQLLSLYEGKTIDFETDLGWGQKKIVTGKIIRSGYTPHSQQAMQRYGQPYYQSQMTMATGTQQPIIEVDGKLQFSMPGKPIFPALTDDTILKPQIAWKLNSDKAAKLDAELAYVTGGMSWEAEYNIVAPEDSDKLDVVGWVTMDNQSGKTFENAKIKLMAGDVSKIQPTPESGMMYRGELASTAGGPSATVREKAFEDYHLYTLARPATLHDRESKQVEFIRASNVQSQKVYVYDGLKIDWTRYRGYGMENLRNNQEVGAEMDTKVAVMREFKNSEANHLGMPLPKGKVRFYKQDKDKQIEFTGENTIDHTPRDETVRIYTGNAFDLTGERRRTFFKSDSNNHWIDEGFEIKLRNHTKEQAEIRVVEHMFRWYTWDITDKSDTFQKMNAQTAEFRVQVKPDEEKTIHYTVHYSW